uniref:Uncharacterized protein n=1 Tax=Myotis myotis TaxID=51298 RepID=A0A7J7Z4S1_MYOMY|nr:hypothetical protein mMyoMyo1_010594 [Myotis myotis]
MQGPQDTVSSLHSKSYWNRGCPLYLLGLTPHNSKPIARAEVREADYCIKQRGPAGQRVLLTSACTARSLVLHTVPSSHIQSFPHVCEIRINLQNSFTKVISLCFMGFKGISKVILVKHHLYESSVGVDASRGYLGH